MSEAAVVLDRLKRQQEKYREMGAVALVPSSDVDVLLSAIARKRTLLTEVEALEAELAPIKARWAEVRAGFSDDEARQVQATLDETRRVLQELVTREDAGRALLEAKREPEPLDLQAMMRRNQARGSYGAR